MKKENKTTTSILFVLDKSGSMSSCESGTVSGFNEYINNLKKDKKNSYKFSLTLFDTVYDKRYSNVPLSKVEELSKDNYQPSGMTALYDAACSTIKDAEKSAKKNDKFLVVIMTDGEENSSQEYTDKDLKAMIKKLEATKKWTFVFLGANQDSYAVARKYGLSAQNVSNYNSTDKGVTRAFAAMCASTSDFAGGAGGSTANFFSKKDQDDLENTK